ncbi:MAG: ABC transporter ATP-binding protein [Propionibacteriaceae bacterium]|nr:ABC transporter ATP-binding protein [Propionibacteriaceae bacterium]
MLELTDVTLTYPDGDDRVKALNNVSLTVEAGTFAAVTGPSGSGKSSLLAVASTLVTPDSGRVSIAGSDITRMKSREKAALRQGKLGIVFQSPNLIPSLTVREQLEVVLRLGGRKAREEGVARIPETLEAVGCSNLADRLPSQLSGGQQQRVNIARAIVHEPSVLLVDEPTSALDQERSAEIIELLAQLTHDRQLATVVVTHEPEHLPSFDAAFEMRDGVLAPLRRRMAA